MLLTVAAAALGGLALLPTRTAASPDVLVSTSAAASLRAEAEPAAVLGRPPVRRPTVVKPAKPAKPAVAARRVVPRATRKRVLSAPAEAVANVDGYACPIRGRTSFSDTWGDPRPGGRRHKGTDIMAAYGAPVVAVISGVVQTTYSAAGGISLYLRGSDGNVYYYAHNSRNVAVSGQRVATGQLIAYVGNSGNASGGVSHVHFELQPGGGAAVNSYPFVRRVC